MAISDNQRDDNADTRQKNQPDSVISNGGWYKTLTKILTGFRIDLRLKDLAVEAAGQENPSLSNYIENLIRKDVEIRGLLLPVGLGKK